MFQEGIGYSEVTLRVFKVNRIDLMRHSRRAYFACFDTLLEIVHGDIRPYISVEVYQYGIDTLHKVKKSRHMVVVLYLSGRERMV